jgi:hypothetical protein
VLEASAEESARFDKARSEARTSCEGLLDGQRFDRIAGNVEDDCKEGRKEGPPSDR